ncbi:carboxymuconolactone decarboxylase family protein [Streptomyces griseoviridis]|jgi:AhpD family alkylhydroperoxidase|uniref:AhpD family alkylhydroperoxidase n=1 Tax=Streptomyces griseoviridis TaxID=45398 RepID=A0ABT9LE94_STRGD|nr:carboxymuconolactone decarboxylase family protein [Streptomyces griseoviridis]MDP9682029.1 AhpD family alkylhydroperoxidase [Streptomyces griseoviridis]GGT02979.1 alkyl hydroperoxide reductase AhpD [Streptomyces griseoviridis]
MTTTTETTTTETATTPHPEARLNLFANPLTRKFFGHLTTAVRALGDSTLPAATAELVKIRASQINGCGMCLDMHTKEAMAAGETPLRLNLVATWREATVFTEAERAALALTEEGTRLADASPGVTDTTWSRAAEHYDEDELAALITLIAVINMYNRFNVIVRQPAGGYEPGMFG